MSLELDTLTKSTDKLSLAVRSHILPLADKLLTKSLITSENHSSLLNTRSDEIERASLLVKFIREKVTLDSKNYHVFVEVLISDRSTYKEILEDLEPIYKAEPTEADDDPPTTSDQPSDKQSGNLTIWAMVVLVSVLLFAVVIPVYLEPRIDGVSSQPLPQKKNEKSKHPLLHPLLL